MRSFHWCFRRIRIGSKPQEPWGHTWRNWLILEPKQILRWKDNMKDLWCMKGEHETVKKVCRWKCIVHSAEHTWSNCSKHSVNWVRCTASAKAAGASTAAGLKDIHCVLADVGWCLSATKPKTVVKGHDSISDQNMSHVMQIWCHWLSCSVRKSMSIYMQTGAKIKLMLVQNP